MNEFINFKKEKKRGIFNLTTFITSVSRTSIAETHTETCSKSQAANLSQLWVKGPWHL